MKNLKGLSNRVVEIDLNSRTFSMVSVPETDVKMYLGGKGLALKFYYDRLKGRLSEVDPLGEENILCFMTGVLAGTGGVCSARFEGVTKSPLTGIMVSASCGGPFGIACRSAGYDGVLIRGKADTPVRVEISDDGVDFIDAAGLWGKETSPVHDLLKLDKKDGALVIGPGGENGVLYANIASGGRFLGRGGMGAVMGSKNLKAVVARGGAYKIVPALPEMFDRTRKKSISYIRRNFFCGSYGKYGTAATVIPGIAAGYAPVMNFRDRTDERLVHVSGEAMAERYSSKPASCLPCSIVCGHKGTFPDGKVRKIPEYETVGVFGGNIGNYDPDLIGLWNERMNELGIDTISAGVTISWAMEADEKNIRKSDLRFGRTGNIIGILEDIAFRRGEGKELSEGTRRLSERYGGEDFAIHVKGLEIAAYDPRAAWGQGLNYAVANRGGCHLNAYPVGQEVLFGFLDPYSTAGKAEWVDFFEDLFSAVNSLQTCQFTGFGYILEPPLPRFTPKPVLKFFMSRFPKMTRLALDYSVLSRYFWSVTGIKMTMRKFHRCGRRIHILERYMNTLMGVDAAQDTLPGRFLHEAETKHPVKSTVDLGPMKKRYYRLKGYDENGIPLSETLRALGIGAAV